MTPKTVHRASKVAFALFVVALLTLMLGPFQGLEQRFGLTDKSAHAITFFAFANSLFVIAPRSRRTGLGLIVLLLALVSELLQGLFGRDVSIGDFGADALGVAAALTPGYVERLRHHIRTNPDVPLRRLLALDRRMLRGGKRRRRRPASKTVAAETTTSPV